MHFSAKVPGVTLERHMDLACLIAARQASAPSPTWSAIFTKAFALVAARTPVFRTAYLTFPWPRFYEHGTSIATINIDRQLDNERVILYAHIDSPESRTLREIDAIIRDHKERPVESIPSYRSAVRMSRLPWPLRRPGPLGRAERVRLAPLPFLRHFRDHVRRFAGGRHHASVAAADVSASLRHIRSGWGAGDASLFRSPGSRRGDCRPGTRRSGSGAAGGEGSLRVHGASLLFRRRRVRSSNRTPKSIFSHLDPIVGIERDVASQRSRIVTLRAANRRSRLAGSSRPDTGCRMWRRSIGPRCSAGSAIITPPASRRFPRTHMNESSASAMRSPFCASRTIRGAAGSFWMLRPAMARDHRPDRRPRPAHVRSRS